MDDGNRLIAPLVIIFAAIVVATAIVIISVNDSEPSVEDIDLEGYWYASYNEYTSYSGDTVTITAKTNNNISAMDIDISYTNGVLFNGYNQYQNFFGSYVDGIIDIYFQNYGMEGHGKMIDSKTMYLFTRMNTPSGIIIANTYFTKSPERVVSTIICDTDFTGTWDLEKSSNCGDGIQIETIKIDRQENLFVFGNCIDEHGRAYNIQGAAQEFGKYRQIYMTVAGDNASITLTVENNAMIMAGGEFGTQKGYSGTFSKRGTVYSEPEIPIDLSNSVWKLSDFGSVSTDNEDNREFNAYSIKVIEQNDFYVKLAVIFGTKIYESFLCLTGVLNEGMNENILCSFYTPNPWGGIMHGYITKDHKMCTNVWYDAETPCMEFYSYVNSENENMEDYIGHWYATQMISVNENNEIETYVVKDGLNVMGYDLEINEVFDCGLITGIYQIPFTGIIIEKNIIYAEIYTNGCLQHLKGVKNGNVIMINVLEYYEQTGNTASKTIIYSKDNGSSPAFTPYDATISGDWICTYGSSMTSAGECYDIAGSSLTISVKENGTLNGYMEQNSYDSVKSVSIKGQMICVNNANMGWYIDERGTVGLLTCQGNELISYSSGYSNTEKYLEQKITTKRIYSRDGSAFPDTETITLEGKTYIGGKTYTLGTDSADLTISVNESKIKFVKQIGNRVCGYITETINGIYQYNQFDGYINTVNGKNILHLRVQSPHALNGEYLKICNITENSYFDTTLMSAKIDGKIVGYTSTTEWVIENE